MTASPSIKASSSPLLLSRHRHILKRLQGKNLNNASSLLRAMDDTSTEDQESSIKFSPEINIRPRRSAYLRQFGKRSVSPEKKEVEMAFEEKENKNEANVIVEGRKTTQRKRFASKTKVNLFASTPLRPFPSSVSLDLNESSINPSSSEESIRIEQEKQQIKVLGNVTICKSSKTSSKPQIADKKHADNAAKPATSTKCDDLVAQMLEECDNIENSKINKHMQNTLVSKMDFLTDVVLDMKKKIGAKRRSRNLSRRSLRRRPSLRLRRRSFKSSVREFNNSRKCKTSHENGSVENADDDDEDVAESSGQENEKAQAMKSVCVVKLDNLCLISPPSLFANKSLRYAQNCALIDSESQPEHMECDEENVQTEIRSEIEKVDVKQKGIKRKAGKNAAESSSTKENVQNLRHEQDLEQNFALIDSESHPKHMEFDEKNVQTEIRSEIEKVDVKQKGRKRNAGRNAAESSNTKEKVQNLRPEQDLEQNFARIDSESHPNLMEFDEENVQNEIRSEIEKVDVKQKGIKRKAGKNAAESSNTKENVQNLRPEKDLEQNFALIDSQSHRNLMECDEENVQNEIRPEIEKVDVKQKGRKRKAGKTSPESSNTKEIEEKVQILRSAQDLEQNFALIDSESHRNLMECDEENVQTDIRSEIEKVDVKQKGRKRNAGRNSAETPNTKEKVQNLKSAQDLEQNLVAIHPKSHLNLMECDEENVLTEIRSEIEKVDVKQTGRKRKAGKNSPDTSKPKENVQNLRPEQDLEQNFAVSDPETHPNLMECDEENVQTEIRSEIEKVDATKQTENQVKEPPKKRGRKPKASKPTDEVVLRRTRRAHAVLNYAEKNFQAKITPDKTVTQQPKRRPRKVKDADDGKEIAEFKVPANPPKADAGNVQTKQSKRKANKKEKQGKKDQIEISEERPLFAMAETSLASTSQSQGENECSVQNVGVMPDLDICETPSLNGINTRLRSKDGTKQTEPSMQSSFHCAGLINPTFLNDKNNYDETDDLHLTRYLFRAGGLETRNIIVKKGNSLRNNHRKNAMVIYVTNGEGLWKSRTAKRKIELGSTGFLKPGSDVSITAVTDLSITLTIPM